MTVHQAENPEAAELSRGFGWLLLLGDGGTARSSEVETGEVGLLHAVQARDSDFFWSVPWSPA
jgi:hypothetical protein